MNAQNRATLKSYFLTNAIPTADQFAQLIDSFIDKVDDNITVSTLKNIGIGDSSPNSNFSVKSEYSTLSGKLSSTTNVSEFAGVETLFSTELSIGEKIIVAGITYTVSSIQSNILLKVVENISTPITSATTTILLDVFSIKDLTGNILFYVSKNGNIGIKNNTPSYDFDITGTIQATSYIGDGTGIKKLQATNLEGIVPAANLPAISSNTSTGLFTINETYDKSVVGSVSGTISTTSLNGVNTDFNTLIQNQQFKIGDSSTIYTVVSIQSGVLLTLSPALTETITNATIYVAGNLFLLNNIAGTSVLDVDGIGNLNTKGSVTATSFIGDGTGIKKLQATNLEGIVPAASIGQVNATSILGTLLPYQIPILDPTKVQQYINFYVDNPIIKGEQAVVLNWESNSLSILQLDYWNDGNLISLNSASAGIPLQTKEYSVKVNQDTVFTLTGKGVTEIIQKQISVKIIQTINQFSKQLYSQGYSILYVLNECSNRYNLLVLNVANLTTIATAIKNAGYTATDAFQYIPQFYRNTGQTWDVSIYTPILNSIFSTNTQNIINNYAISQAAQGVLLKPLITNICNNYNLKDSTISANVQSLALAIATVDKFSVLDIFQLIPQYYRGIGQPWNPSIQGIILNNVFS